MGDRRENDPPAILGDEAVTGIGLRPGVALADDRDVVQPHTQLGEGEPGGLAQARQEGHVADVEEPGQEVDVVRDAGPVPQVDRTLGPELVAQQLHDRHHRLGGLAWAGDGILVPVAELHGGLGIQRVQRVHRPGSEEEPGGVHESTI